MKIEKWELEANLTSIRIELSENEHLKLEAETKRDDLAKVGFRNDIVISIMLVTSIMVTSIWVILVTNINHVTWSMFLH